MMKLFLVAVVGMMSLGATSFGGVVKVGEAMESKGRVEVVKPDAVRGAPLKLGGIIEAGDIVRTSSGASAVLLLVDGSVLEVGASSRVKFYELNKNSDTHVNLEKGDVLFDITPITPIRGTFKIKTTTSIIGVKGTNFRVIATESRTKVTMNRGVVAISSVLSPKKSVSVSAGQVAVITSSGVQTRKQTQSEQSETLIDLQATPSVINGRVNIPNMESAPPAADIAADDSSPVTPPDPVDPKDKRPDKPDPTPPTPPTPSGPAVKIIVK